MKNKALCAFTSFGFFCISAFHAQTEQADPIPKQKWSFNGLTGTFKRDALQRGFQVFKEICSSCHGIKQLRFRELEHIGFTPAQVQALAASYSIDDGPNLEGEMFNRPGLPSDAYPRPYKNENQAKSANNGAYPVDLSLITKARKGGADYVYALLTGYAQAPNGFSLREGEHYNRYFSGRKIAMAPPLMMDDQVTYADGTKATISQMAQDVVTFLSFVSEPEMERRKQSGIQTLLYLCFMTTLLYLLKRRIWRNVT